mmetsp:Transcript_24329/g.57997  ORF Transcript_24329/g.57997 Transcript_24329/m.57997 type:complete len:207 (-) Transcript_24329:660-1280(-)
MPCKTPGLLQEALCLCPAAQEVAVARLLGQPGQEGLQGLAWPPGPQLCPPQLQVGPGEARVEVCRPAGVLEGPHPRLLALSRPRRAVAEHHQRLCPSGEEDRGCPLMVLERHAVCLGGLLCLPHARPHVASLRLLQATPDMGTEGPLLPGRGRMLAAQVARLAEVCAHSGLARTRPLRCLSAFHGKIEIVEYRAIAIDRSLVFYGY